MLSHPYGAKLQTNVRGVALSPLFSPVTTRLRRFRPDADVGRGLLVLRILGAELGRALDRRAGCGQAVGSGRGEDHCCSGVMLQSDWLHWQGLSSEIELERLTRHVMLCFGVSGLSCTALGTCIRAMGSLLIIWIHVWAVMSIRRPVLSKCI